MSNRKKNFGLYLGCFSIVAVILLVLFAVLRMAPFGDSTLAISDANIQYIDFFAWFHDVLHGKNNISYTFGKTLGGTNIAVYSYYLASPLNLFVYFFKKTQLQTFFDLMVLIKLSLASATCGIWLNRRFGNQLRPMWTLLLSIGYGLCQYDLYQCSNIMWLDGVILLPLILLGVYYVIWKKNIVYLSIFVGISIFSNWYTGGINCIFSVIMVLLEMCLYAESRRTCGNRCKISDWVVSAVRYMISMLIGVCLSACLFLPTIMTLRGGRGALNRELFYNTLIANPVSFLPGFSVGAVNWQGNVSLFCGSLAVIGCVGILFSKLIRKSQKAIVYVFLAVCLLIFYWQPAICLFSMFKDVSSYWYRYSYVGIIGIVFCAAFYFSQKDQEEKANIGIIVGTAVFAGMMMFVNKVKSIQNDVYLILTVVFMIIMAVFVVLINNRRKIRWKQLCCLLLGAFVIGELTIDSTLLLKKYHYDGVSAYETYEQNQEEQINTILSADNSYYRMTQLKNRSTTFDGLTYNYNEALAFGYWSISGYTSDPDDDQREMLEHFGYRMNGVNFNVVDTTVLTADSLFGVKYVLADREINGLEKQEQFSTLNGKDIYLNPYCLPLAFRYEGNTDSVTYQKNPFLYQNELYSSILGHEVELYTPVPYQENRNDNVVQYRLEIPEGNVLLYGNLPWGTWQSEYDGTLNVNNAYQIGYAKWSSPSVFDIPVSEGMAEAEISLSAESEVVVTDVQFYALNLDVFRKVVDEISAKAATINEMENGYVQIETTAQKGEKLFLAIPVNDGWKIKVNDKEVTAEQVADSLMGITLEEGENVIELSYHVPGLKQGICVSFVGIVLLGISIYLNKRKK